MSKLAGDLKGSADPSSKNLMGGQAINPVPLKKDFTPIGFVKTGDEVKEGGLPCSIRSDESCDRSLLDIQGTIIYRLNSAKTL